MPPQLKLIPRESAYDVAINDVEIVADAASSLDTLKSYDPGTPRLDAETISMILSGRPSKARTTANAGDDLKPGAAKMNEISRHELDAKLAATEARMDTRVAEIVGRLDILIVSQQGLDRLYQKQFADLAAAQDAQKSQVEAAKKEQLQAIGEAQKASTADMVSLKRTIAVAGIGTALTVLFGIAAFNATLLSNMMASFESGKNTMQQVNQVSNQLNETARKLAEVEAKLEGQKLSSENSSNESQPRK